MEPLAVAALNHSNIVAVYDVGGEDGIAYMLSRAELATCGFR
jgi:hypothetical protein